jgi:tRNA-Thr(GGU) m(6)t(6)A37 methyltransferase TsaA
MTIVLAPIGVIRTPFKTIEAMPIQPAGAKDVEGRVILEPAFTQGLDDIEGFSHLILIYGFHRSQGFELRVKPFLDDSLRGLFATRAPRRPNPIGISTVALMGREGNVLHIRGADVIDETPLFDIKPHVPAFDAPDSPRIGWLEGKACQAEQARSDKRFQSV